MPDVPRNIVAPPRNGGGVSKVWADCSDTGVGLFFSRGRYFEGGFPIWGVSPYGPIRFGGPNATGDGEMTTKAIEAATGCYAKALDDEPMFVLLARDPDAPRLVRAWADKREATNAPDPRWETGLFDGEKKSRSGGEWVTPPHPDAAQIAEARYCAARMEVWRYENDGKWREPGK